MARARTYIERGLFTAEARNTWAQCQTKASEPVADSPRVAVQDVLCHAFGFAPTLWRRADENSRPTRPPLLHYKPARPTFEVSRITVAPGGERVWTEAECPTRSSSWSTALVAPSSATTSCA